MDNRHAFRASWHDYADGIYFVTICSHAKKHIFGHIANSEMHMSELGVIASQCLESIPTHFPHAEIINKVIMPNHIHIIISVQTPTPISDPISVRARYIAPTSSIAHKPIIPPEKSIGCLKPPMHGEKCNDFHHNSQLAQIVGSFKAAVTREYNRRMRARCIAPLPQIWQRLYHEHIIRNQYAFDNIMNYIDNYIANWKHDCFHPS